MLSGPESSGKDTGFGFLVDGKTVFFLITGLEVGSGEDRLKTPVNDVTRVILIVIKQKMPDFMKIMISGGKDEPYGLVVFVENNG